MLMNLQSLQPYRVKVRFLQQSIMSLIVHRYYILELMYQEFQIKPRFLVPLKWVSNNIVSQRIIQDSS